jgi:hypothetical protein
VLLPLANHKILEKILKTHNALLAAVLSACISAIAHAQQSLPIPSTTWIGPSNSPYETTVNPAFDFFGFGGGWDTSSYNELTYAIMPLRPNEEMCRVLEASGSPEGCNVFAAAYQTAAQSLPAPNSAACGWFSWYCDQSVSAHFSTVASSPWIPIGNALRSASANLNSCYSSSFSNPDACEDAYSQEIEASCENVGNFIDWLNFNQDSYQNALAMQVTCRINRSQDLMDIAAARTERQFDGQDWFGFQVNAEFGTNLGPFGINFVRSADLDQREGYNRGLIAARKYENCRNYAMLLQQNGCLDGA